jgi:hypothetical protein
MLPTLNYDVIFSDPLLLLAGVFLIAGPLVFLIALVKFIAAGRKQNEFAPLFDEVGPFSRVEPELPPASSPAPFSSPTPSTNAERAQAREDFPPSPAPERESVMDKTTIMPSGMGEVQGQLEIAFSQIKTLNKKILQIESELDSVARSVTGRLDRNELQEVPMNPSDFTQKLLKLAEHVIVLEKEVERLKGSNGQDGPPTESEPAGSTETATSQPRAPRPPVMPI